MPQDVTCHALHVLFQTLTVVRPVLQDIPSTLCPKLVFLNCPATEHVHSVLWVMSYREGLALNVQQITVKNVRNKKLMNATVA